jgi:2-oxoglutarate/2-oxoacid ferredoxin oxidoreductase subunit alpha
MLGQMMEPVEFKQEAPKKTPVRKDALRGAAGRPRKIVKSFTSNPADLEEINWSLHRRYQLIKDKEAACERFMTDDAKLVVVAFGASARIAKGAIKTLRADGLKVGLLRPITLWPFPDKELQSLAQKINNFLVFEMNMGQMIDDVKLALNGQHAVEFYGRPGGIIPTPDEIARVLARLYHQKGLKQ